MGQGSQQIIDALNKDLSDELAAIVQYMWHHVMGAGMDSAAITAQMRLTSLDEMRHAEMIAERIDYLGGVPTATLSQVLVGGELRKMIQDDLDGENRAIAGYKEHIKLCFELSDHTTRVLLETILSDEERHAHTWETILG
ncbi:MAG: ferritin [Chloroflexi bacterium]|nr:ferritin [Chloroflexota bacterium]